MSLHNELSTDGHVFKIPTDPAERFRFIRDQTVTSYRAMTGGTPTAQDMAFFFGTISTEINTKAGNMELATTQAATLEATSAKIADAKTKIADGVVTSTQDKEIGISSHGRKRNYDVFEAEETEGKVMKTDQEGKK
ncbi:uncharacterized protein LAJ45_00992 [Morchella importuna]|uniref:uncharacterized protein n=1 Tax=Morchella importuna TaxID=1174673 RepID=UPI001E8CFCC8|nr:uncharacterized protein LAJ45_00992 [Morchella importuna]KAH8154465.1 hypothetical protein LAJ45_00992 [Morchella importuna]